MKKNKIRVGYREYEHWIPFVSYTGSELTSVCNRLNIRPTAVVTNNNQLPIYNNPVFNRVVYVNNRPKAIDYVRVFHNFQVNPNTTLVTLHGWNRIIPKIITEEFTMYNIHPGDIVNFPELKGSDPQQKAIDLKLPFTGCVIHKVIEEVDAGEVILSSDKVVVFNKDIDQLNDDLKEEAINLWERFFTEIDI